MSKRPGMTYGYTRLSIVIVLVLVLNNGAGAQQVINKNLWASGTGHYQSYRIPSLAVTAKGTILAFAEGRNKSGDSGDIDILERRSSDNGKTWSASRVVWDDGPNTCGNPTVVVDRETGRVWLFMTWNRGEDSERDIVRREGSDTRHPYATYSDDDGRTWSKPADLSRCCKNAAWGWFATGPGSGIQLIHGEHKGRLVVPCDFSYDTPDGHHYGKHGYGALVLYSDDQGKHWKMSEPIKPEVNESQVAERGDGTLVMNMRSYDGQYSRAIATSTNGGGTWSKVTNDHQLVESQCQASIVRYGNYEDQSMILFSNPAVAVGRTHMTVRASFDDGRSWIISKLIYPGPSAYSSLAKLPDGNIGLFFEAGNDNPYETMKFLSFPPADLFSKTKLVNNP